MALFHLSVTQTKRSAGQSAIASAAYRAGERLYSEYYGEYSDYTRKGGVICSDILLPSHAPPEYADRQTLWNAVEKAERGKNAQLAYSFDIALGSIDITAAVRSLLFIGKLKDSPTTRVLIHEKSSLAPPGQSLAFSLGDEKGFEWIGAYDITADELLAGTDTAKTESKTAQAQMLILELLADGKRMPSAELEKAVNERGISSRTMRTAKSRIGDRLVTEKDGTAWVCYLRN